MASASCTTVTREGIDGSRTVGQFARALALALLATLLGCAIYLAEKHAYPQDSRFAKNPIEIMVRCLGLAHFLVGWLFLLTSSRLRSPPALGRLLLGTLAGIALCALFACLGSLRNPFLYLLFYGSFLFHEVRDEAVIYRNHEDARSPELLGSFSLATALLFVTLLSAGYAFFLTCFSRGGPSPVGLWAVAGALAVAAAWSMHRFLRLTRGELARFLTEHRPLVVVYLALLGILVLSAPLGSIGVIVLVHVASWLLFVRSRLQDRPAPSPRHLWAWLRSTPTGFLVLHLGLALVLFVLMALRVHVWRRGGFLSESLAAGSFCYWALMHICTSFWSSR
ncbi:MAG TPA: hypothetical protein VKA46_11150 [Gemmataceae bacterium]|nr:hypothetical protein [Gemmataceae bacterium]